MDFTLPPKNRLIEYFLIGALMFALLWYASEFVKESQKNAAPEQIIAPRP